MKPNPQVLLVDRNANDVKVVRDTLGSAGLEIHVRASASAALVAFHALEPDLVIVDSDVPGTSGAAVTREIKNTERGRATPVILMAEGPLEETQRAQALTATGCSMLLQKPLMPQDLLDSLTRFLPAAFIGKGPEASSAPKSTAPRRAAGVMRDPGTPFTADSFDEDSLGALLDQVFPTSDSGGLAKTIRAHASKTPEVREETPTPLEAKASAPRAAEPPSAAEPPAAPDAASARAAQRATSAAGPRAGSARETEPDTSEFIADYLAKDDPVEANEEAAKGLSVKDAEVLDRIFDGPWTQPTPGDEDIEPLESAASQDPSPQDLAPTTSAAPSHGPAAPSQEPTAAASFTVSNDASFSDLGLDEPMEDLDSGLGVWQELEAALPSAPSSASSEFEDFAGAGDPLDRSTMSEPLSAPATPAPSAPPKRESAKAESPRAESVKTESPAAAKPESPATKPIPAAPKPAAPAPVEATAPSAKPVVPSTSYAKAATPPSKSGESTSVTSIPLSPAPVVEKPAATEKPAAPPVLASSPPVPIETIPLAREGSAASGASTTSAESRRSKKNKKGKGRRGDHPESIPLATQDPSMALPGSMKSQSVAESPTMATVIPDRSVSSGMSESSMLGEPPMASVAPRRSGRIAVVVAGLALAAAVGAYFVLTRSGDSDLQPTSPDRPHTTSSPEEVPSDEPVSPDSTTPTSPGIDETVRENLPPVIPESTTSTSEADTPEASTPSGSPSAPSEGAPSESRTPADPSERTAKPLPSQPTARPTAAGRSGAPAPDAVPVPKTSAGGPPASSRDAGAPSSRRSTAGSLPPSTSTPTAAPGASRSRPPKSAPEPPTAPAQSPTDTDAPSHGSGPPASASKSGAEPGTSDPPSEAPPEPVGQVALGATMPTPPELDGTGGVPEVDAVQSLASPVPLSRPAPSYPASAMAMRTTGTVGLLVKVEEDGRVSEVKVVRTAAPALNAAAVAAAHRWTYKPAHRGMDPVATWIEETVVFRLK